MSVDFLDFNRRIKLNNSFSVTKSEQLVAEGSESETMEAATESSIAAQGCKRVGKDEAQANEFARAEALSKAVWQIPPL